MLKIHEFIEILKEIHKTSFVIFGEYRETNSLFSKMASGAFNLPF